MTGEQVRARMQPRLAWQALRKLIADPEDTAQVFTIVRAMSGPSLQRGYRRFARLPTGRRVIDREIDLLETLSNRAGLRASPSGTLARAYLDFVESEHLDADGLVEASETQEPRWENAELERYGKRLRDQHDL